MFESVLVANRGEIARRVITTAHRMGIEAIAVYLNISGVIDERTASATAASLGQRSAK